MRLGFILLWMKWSYFFTLSTNKNILSFPSYVGRTMIKSMDTSDHFWDGIWRGCRRLGRATISNFCLRHVSHLTTYFWISVFIPFQKKDWQILWYVLKKPTWPVVGGSWFSFKIWVFNFDELGKYILYITICDLDCFCFEWNTNENDHILLIWQWLQIYHPFILM